MISVIAPPDGDGGSGATAVSGSAVIGTGIVLQGPTLPESE